MDLGVGCWVTSDEVCILRKCVHALNYLALGKGKHIVCVSQLSVSELVGAPGFEPGVPGSIPSGASYLHKRR